MIFTVKRGEGLRGEISVPGDKSMSHRSIILASLAEGESKISGLLEGEDCLATIEVFKKMGIDISSKKGVYSVIGNGLQGLKEPNEALDFGNSGTSIRLCAIVIFTKFFLLLTGDKSLSSRPMQRVVDPLNAMGADITASEEGTLPISSVRSSSLHAIEYSLPVASAQVKSCLMLAGLFAERRNQNNRKDHNQRSY